MSTHASDAESSLKKLSTSARWNRTSAITPTSSLLLVHAACAYMLRERLGGTSIGSSPPSMEPTVNADDRFPFLYLARR